MKTILHRLRPIAASPSVAAALLTLLLCLPAWGSFCNNPTPPCEPKDPKSPCYKPPPPPKKCGPKPCDTCTKSPCYTGSGVYVSDAMDLQLATVGFPIDVARHYETSRNIDGITGYGWSSSLSTRLYYAVFLKAAPSTYEREADILMPDGSIMRFVENANGSFTPPEGRFDTLVRNGDGTWDLWLQQSRSHLHFGSTGNLLSMVDDYGNVQTWTYVNDRVTRVEDSAGSGRYVDITYGADGRISDVTDLTGRNVHYTYDVSGMMTAAHNAAAQATNYTYVAGKYNPLLSAITDHWGRNVTTITYDAQDRVKTYTEKGETYTYTYAYNNVATTTAKSDSAGNLWQYPFASGGLVTDSIPPGGGAAEHTDFDANGLPLTHTNPVGVKTRNTYDARGNVVTRTFDYQGPTAVEWRFVYDTNFPDHVVSVTPYTPGTNNVHPHWQGRKFDYYPPGSTAPGAMHRVYEVDDDGVTSRVMRTYTYDSRGRRLTETFPNGAVRTFTYDSSGNLQSEEGAANNDAGVRPITTFTHDALGRLLTTTDPLGNVTTYTWDVLDRLVSRTDPIPSAGSSLNFTTTRFYDEYDSATQLLSIRTVDANGATVTISKDAYGQIVRHTDAGGQAVRFTWTKGLMTARYDANNYATTFTYDARRRLDTITYPDSGYERYTYYADNNIATFRNRAGTTVTYTYDRFQRMTAAADPGGVTINWTFDGMKLVSVSDGRTTPAETLTRTWSPSFRIASETQSSRGTLFWTYHNDGRTMTESVAGGATTTYGYHPDGSLRSIQWSPIAGSFLHQYDLAGRKTQIQFPNGQTRTFAYDGQSRITSVANVHPTTGNLATFSYGYDVNAYTGVSNRLGLQTTITTSFPALSIAGGVTKFDYDVRRTLIRADYPAGAPYNALASAWSFDAAGNRISATTNGVTASYTYGKYGANPLNGSVLQSDGGSSYTYDGAGNTLTRSGARGNYTFTWDADQRLVSVGGDESATYRYDVIHRRVSTVTPAGTTNYLYSGFDPVAESGSSSAQFLFTGELDQPLAMIRGGQTYYYAVDGLGSVVAVNDAAGAVVNSYAYDAWGVPVARNETVASPFGFTARPFGAAGLTDHRFRAYEPATGSFRSVDPLIAWAGRALAGKGPALLPHLPDYAYGPQPTMSTDPFGLKDCAECYEDYDRETRRCRRDLNADMMFCMGFLAGCLKLSANLPWCTGGYVLCILKAFYEFKTCMDDAAEDLQSCLQGCSPRCPVGPPPQMMPSHGPGGGPPPMSSHGPGGKALAGA